MLYHVQSPHRERERDSACVCIGKFHVHAFCFCVLLCVCVLCVCVCVCVCVCGGGGGGGGCLLVCVCVWLLLLLLLLFVCVFVVVVLGGGCVDGGKQIMSRCHCQCHATFFRTLLTFHHTLNHNQIRYTLFIYHCLTIILVALKKKGLTLRMCTQFVPLKFVFKTTTVCVV